MANIGADDQQHHHHRAHEQAKHGTNGADNLLLQRNGFEPFELVFRIRGLQLAREREQFRIQLCGSHAGLDAGDCALVIGGASGNLGTRRKLDPHGRFIRKGKSGGEHANNGAGATVVVNHMADGALHRTKMFLGERARYQRL